MAEAPPRKRFQIHLSTAIVLMFVAGALIWANIRPTRLEPDKVFIGGGSGDPRYQCTETEFRKRGCEYEGQMWFGLRRTIYGWPCKAMHRSMQVAVLNHSGKFL